MDKQIKENAVFHTAETFANYFLSFLTVSYAARILKPEAMGNIAFCSAVISYFTMIAQLGIPIYGMRLVAQNRDDVRQSEFELVILETLLTAFSCIALLGLISVVPRLREFRNLFLILGISLALKCVDLRWLFQGLGEYRTLSLHTLAVKALSVILLFVFVRSERDSVPYAFISAFSSAGVILLNLARTPHVLTTGPALRWPDLRKHLKPVCVFFLMACAGLIYTNLDIVMLGFLSRSREVGYYQIAAKIKVFITAPGGIIWHVTLPKATKLWKQGDKAGFEILAQEALVFLCAVQTLVTVALIMFAGPAVRIVGGAEYAASVPCLRILMLSVLPIAISNIIGGQILIPSGHENYLLAAQMAGAVMNLILNALLIPARHGTGAAVSTVAAEMTVTVITWYYAKRKLNMNLFPNYKKIRHTCGKALKPVVFKAIEKLSFGKELPYYCPCCNTRLYRWKKGNYTQHPEMFDVRRYKTVTYNTLCPVCNSLQRHRIVAEYLGSRIQDEINIRILYFAVEECMGGWLNRNKIKYTSADLYKPADLKINIEDTGLTDGAYDLIICNHVLEHVNDYKKALKELRRILSDEGILLCSFPIDMRFATVYEDYSITDKMERIRHFGQADHLRIFGRDSREILRNAGFEVTTIDEETPLGDDILPVTGPADYDLPIVFVCRKNG